jgi:hypothetical protein
MNSIYGNTRNMSKNPGLRGPFALFGRCVEWLVHRLSTEYSSTGKFPAAAAQSRGPVQNYRWDLRYLGAAGAPVIFSSSAATAARKLSGITFV